MLNDTAIGVILGGLFTGLTAFLTIKQQFKHDLEKHKIQVKSQKLEDAITSIQKALYIISIFKYKFSGFFADPEKYLHRDHPEGECFLDFDEEISDLEMRDFFAIEFDDHCYPLATIALLYFPDLKEAANKLIENIQSLRPNLEYMFEKESYSDFWNFINTIESQLTELRDNLLKKSPLSS